MTIDDFPIFITLFSIYNAISMVFEMINLGRLTTENSKSVQGYIKVSVFFFGFLNNKLLSPFFSTYIGKLINKSYKVSILASIFISSKILEALFGLATKQATNYIKSTKNKGGEIIDLAEDHFIRILR